MQAGYERTSMDVVASRAGTTKRTLYAHFESKEKLFLATFEQVKSLFLARLGTPDRYARDHSEALVQFCARFMETLLWEGAMRMCRICAGEAGRFPEEAADYCYVVLSEVEARVADYLHRVVGLSTQDSNTAAQQLLAQLLYPRFPRALFGVDPLIESFEESGLSPDFDTKPIRRAVSNVMAPLDGVNRKPKK